MLKLLTQEDFPNTISMIDSGLLEEVAPGMVAGFWLASEPETFWVSARGSRRKYPSLLPMNPDTIFDLASVSKVFATASLFALLVQRGWIHWDTPLSAVLSEYPFGKNITCRHLLSHTSGLPAWSPFYEKMKEHFGEDSLVFASVSERQYKMREFVFQVPLDAPVGSRVLYSDLSFLLLGYLLEQITSLPLDDAVTDLLWRPMGLTQPYFMRTTRPVFEAIDLAVAATEDCPWRKGVLQGQVHDDNCWSMGGYAGHAGAFAEISDLLMFAKKMLGGFLSRSVLTEAWSRVSQPQGCERTAGWDTPTGVSPAVGKYFSPQTVGHLGFTGTSFWIDLTRGLAVALLTNRVHPTRENSKIKSFRPRFHDALMIDLFKNGLISRLKN